MASPRVDATLPVLCGILGTLVLGFALMVTNQAGIPYDTWYDRVVAVAQAQPVSTPTPEPVVVTADDQADDANWSVDPETGIDASGYDDAGICQLDGGCN